MPRQQRNPTANRVVVAAGGGGASFNGGTGGVGGNGDQAGGAQVGASASTGDGLVTLNLVPGTFDPVTDACVPTIQPKFTG